MTANFPPACRACGQPLLLQNAYVDDGCPCNSPRGVNVAPGNCRICRDSDCVKPAHRVIAEHAVVLLERVADFLESEMCGDHLPEECAGEVRALAKEGA